MFNKIENKSFFGLPITFTIILHLLSFLYISQFNIVNYIGAIASLLIVIICFLFIITNFNTAKINIIWTTGVVFLFINTINLVSNFNSNSFYLWAQQNALFLYVMNISSISINDISFRKMKKILSILYYVFILVSITSIIFNNESILLKYFSVALYKAFFALSFFVLSNSKHKLFFTVFSSIIFILIGERTSAVTLLFVYITFHILNYLKYHKRLYSLFYWVFAIIMLYISRLYVWLSYQPIAVDLNTISFKYFNERFFSGRNYLWSIAYERLYGNELFGLGLGNSNFIDIGINLSTHNLYVYLLLQGGYLLIFVFLFFMYAIWKRYFNNLTDERVRLSAAYFMGIMLLLNFELLLLVNNFVVSMYLWLVIGIGVLVSNHLNEQAVKERCS